MKGSSPRNSSPVHENVGNLTNQLGKLDLTESGKKIYILRIKQTVLVPITVGLGIRT